MHPLDNEALKLGAKAVRRRRLDAENRQDFISLLGRIVVILLWCCSRRCSCSRRPRAAACSPR